MQRFLFLSAALSLASLAASCGKNQCTHVVERTCSDVRAKAQQLNPNQIPTPEDLCPGVDWTGRERLKEVCTGPEVRSMIADLRPTTPLKVAEAVCDGFKLHILTPAAEELTECRQGEDNYEAAREAKKKEEEDKKKNPKPAETPNPPVAPVSTPVSTSVPSSTPVAPAGTTPPAGTPAGTPPAGAPPAGAPATPAGTPPAGTPPATPPAK